MEIKLERYQKVVDDRIDFYAINEMNTSEDAKRLLLFIEQKYGELEKIHCIRVEDGKITFDKIYPSLQACFAEVGNLLDLTLITTSSGNVVFSTTVSTLTTCLKTLNIMPVEFK